MNDDTTSEGAPSKTPGKRKRLTPKQEAFAHEYVRNGGNATQAYRTAYDSNGDSQHSLEVQGSNLLAHSEVALRVDDLLERQAKAQDLSPAKVLASLSDVAFTPDRDAVKVRALELLGKELGMFADRTTVSGRVDHLHAVAQLSTDDLRALIAEGRGGKLETPPALPEGEQESAEVEEREP
jgi:phage terminase small subunit